MVEVDITALYDIGEEFKFSNKELSAIAMDIVNQYNVFVDQYSGFIKYKDEESHTSKMYDLQAEKEFQTLIDLVLIKKDF